VDVSGLGNAVAISVGEQHACALTGAGTVKCWGENGPGALGNGNAPTNSSLPVDVVGLSNVVAISAGRQHTCAVTSAGTVKCWGNGTSGQLGNGTTISTDVPVDVTNLSNAVAIGAGLAHTCALISDGRAQCWGFNNTGQLGNGTSGNGCSEGSCANSNVPLDVAGFTFGLAGQGSISGTVLAQGGPVANARVEACMDPPGRPCRQTSTNGSGQYTLTGLGDGTYRLQVFPPPGSTLLTAVIRGVVITNNRQLTGFDITLEPPAPIPPDTTIAPATPNPGGTPTVFFGEPLTLRTQGPPGCTVSYRIVQGNPERTLREGPMPETPAGSGTYIATVPALFPFHGSALVRITSSCEPTVSFNIYIDPSGFVRDQNGAPVVGATVSLFRSDIVNGLFTLVPNGSSLMSPSNRVNPDLTDATGHFGWDVMTGFYRVRAQKSGCTALNNPNQAFAESRIMEIPPAVTDLDLRLNCVAVTSELRGQLAHQRVANPLLDLTVKLFEPSPGTPDTQVLRHAFSVTTNGIGQFTVVNPPSGTWDVRVEHRQAVGVEKDSVVIPSQGNVTVNFGTLRAGDADQNIRVTAADFTVLKQTFLQQTKCAIQSPIPSPCADFDGNGTVSPNDFSLLKANFGLTGIQLVV
jgi:hypothetical protein